MLFLVVIFKFLFVAKYSVLVILSRKRNVVMQLVLVFGRLPIAGRKDWAIKSLSRTAVTLSHQLLSKGHGRICIWGGKEEQDEG
jgi:hypothetical protein